MFAQKRSVFVCVVGCVEEDKFHDVLRIVLGLKDVHLGNAMLLTCGRAAVEVPQPRVDVGDPVLDVQDGHQDQCCICMAAVLPLPGYPEIRLPGSRITLARGRWASFWYAWRASAFNCSWDLPLVLIIEISRQPEPDIVPSRLSLTVSAHTLVVALYGPQTNERPKLVWAPPAQTGAQRF